MSIMLLQRPHDQKLENSALEEIIIFTTVLFENTVRKRYTVLVKNSNYLNCPFVG